MRKIFSFIFVVMALTAVAQTPAQMLDKLISAINQAGGATASYAVTSSQGNFKGTIAIKGSKFRILSNDVKTWYNGKTMWSYSNDTQEVYVSTPSASDLATSNPLAAAQNFKKNFTATKAKTQMAGNYAIELKPKGKNDISQAVFYIANGTGLLSKAQLKLKNGMSFSIVLTNYKTKQNLPDNTFTFSSKQVPAHTPVVDLR